MAATPSTASPRDALARALLELHLLGGSAPRGELTERIGCTRSVMDFAAETVREIEVFECCEDSYGYVFYVLQRAEPGAAPDRGGS